MELSREQKLRVNAMIPGFYKLLRESTLTHCVRLYKAGMIAEAIEIAEEFQIKKEEICEQLFS